METTCWTMIREAGAGDPKQRALFVERYEPPIRAYVVARWPGLPHHDDIVQEVFLECLREGGVLERASREERPTSFRAFLLGVVRNVSRRFEAKRVDQQAVTDIQRNGPADADGDPARCFDQEWAAMLVREARRLLDGRLRAGSDSARRRAELLRLRYQEGLPVREIAPLLEDEPRRIHHQLEQARREFRDVLFEVVAQHVDADRKSIERECRELLELIADVDPAAGT